MRTTLMAWLAMPLLAASASAQTTGGAGGAGVENFLGTNFISFFS